MEQKKDNSNLSDVIQLMQSRMTNILAQQIDITATSNALLSLSSMLGDMLSSELGASICAAHEASPVLLETLKQAAQVLSECYSETDPIEISNRDFESLQSISPLVPEEKKEEFEKIVAPEKSKERKLITAENIKWLLGIIIPILFSLYQQSFSNKSEEERLQLHRESNDIAREIVEALEQDSEGTGIEKFLQYLDDNGFALMKKNDVVCEQFERIQNCMSVFEEGIDAVDDLVVPNKQGDNQTEQN